MSTIVALSTAPMSGAIHIIRLSGSNAYNILNKISTNKITKVGYAIQRTNIVSGKRKLDDVLVMKFVSPKSFTGEDLVEINCHGGIYLANKIIGLLVKNGAVLANKGEFSQRAFMNKKLNLNQAEAINNLINSNSDKAIDFANNGLNKQTNEKLISFIDQLFVLLGQVEINIDYPEYDDVPNINKKTFISKLQSISKQCDKIIVDSKNGIRHVHGINVAIVGEPNVGKSTLLNAILNEEKAIVSKIAGTTRDIVEGKSTINGITYNFLDTAGIRKHTSSMIESLGIKKTNDLIEKADIIVLVIDETKKLSPNSKEIINRLTDKNLIIVSNKSDTNSKKSKYISISAKHSRIKPLLNKLIALSAKYETSNSSNILLQSNNSIGILENVKANIDNCIKRLKTNISIDLINQELHKAYDDLLNITGKSSDIDFINKMFSRFCLGK
jgi:tRNA modification GTPase